MEHISGLFLRIQRCNMDKIKFLLIDDEINQKEIFDSVLDEFDNNIELHYAKTPEEAVIALYNNYFHAIIIDLSLKNEDNAVKEDEDLSGNKLLKLIMEREIIPIVVRTGYPDRVTSEIDEDIVNVFTKDNDVHEIITNLIEKYEDCVFEIFGSRGEINQNIKKFFWKVMKDFIKKDDTDISNMELHEKKAVIFRYISSWFNNLYLFDSKYIDANPMEMYMFPNPIDQVCTCDLYKNIDDKKYYIVLTPSCDLANKKIEEVIFCKIKGYDEIENFNNDLENYKRAIEQESNLEKKKNKLEKWFRNSEHESLRYHFLPKSSKFDGGFVDFRSIISVEYDKETGQIADKKFIKEGIITEGFKRDIVCRFSSYYQRQGQPEFNSDIVINNIIK